MKKEVTLQGMKKLDLATMENLSGGGCGASDNVVAGGAGLGVMLLGAASTAVWTCGVSLLICAAIYAGGRMAYGC